jgi:hypothetical protein
VTGHAEKCKGRVLSFVLACHIHRGFEQRINQLNQSNAGESKVSGLETLLLMLRGIFHSDTPHKVGFISLAQD